MLSIRQWQSLDFVWPGKRKQTVRLQQIDPSRARPLCFLHVPKTAGVTVRESLASHFAGDCYSHHGKPSSTDPDGIRDEDLYEFHLRRPHACYLIHIPFAWLKNFPELPYLFVLLREPIDRVVSHYYFLKDFIFHWQLHDTHPLLDAIAKSELAEFAERYPLFTQVYFCELQTRWFTVGPVWEPKDFNPISPPRMLMRGDLRLARSRLQRCDCVGVTDRLEESMSVLSAMFGWDSHQGMGHANRTAQRPQVEDLPLSTRMQLQRLCWADRELYDTAQQQLNRSIATWLTR